MMIPVLMPFSYIAEPMARLLSELVGPLVVYQPLGADVPESLQRLDQEGLIALRSPMENDDDRLRAALAEFTEWARMNPGRATAGTGFVGARQGEVPHFDEDSIQAIRSQIRRHGESAGADEVDPREASFSARLFLAVAQANDQTNDRLDNDLWQFQAMEKGFLDALGVDDDAAFGQRIMGAGMWQEDPGARQTEQRIRSWATLAAADADPLPDLFVSTSPAVIGSLVELYGERLSIGTLATIRYPLAGNGQTPRLAEVLGDLVGKTKLAAIDLDAFNKLAGTGGDEGAAVTLTLLEARGNAPAAVIDTLAITAAPGPVSKGGMPSPSKTLLLLVER